ncbi:MAG: hypothetical protein E7185_11235 [Erysipelotrichaceae bacterium]|nr:hypothetical protein [Erysipelotrichaceae bacterium]
MTKAILWLSVIWLPFLMVYMNVNETKAKKNIILGVTLPQEGREDADVLKELESFKRNEWLSVAVLVVMAAAMWIFSDEHAYMTPWMLWIVFCIVLPYVPYVLSNGRLRNLKVQKGWVQEKRVIRVDTSALPPENWFSPWLFVAPVLVCLLPVLFDTSMAVMYVISAVMCALFWFGYRYLYRNKAEMVDSNAELTAVLTRVRRYNWGKMWLLTAWFMAAFCLDAWITGINALIGIILGIVVTVLLCWLAFRLEMRMRHVQEKLTEQSGDDWYVDDDDHWLGGLLYYNPDDSRLIINNRIGLNSTVNIARPAGKVFIALSLVMILAMPLLGGFLDGGVKKEITLAVEDDRIVCTSGMGSYRIDLDDVQEIKVLEELPSNMRRSFGTGTETLLQGRFSADGYGSMEVNLDPRQGPYLLITTEGKTYLFGTRDGSAVREIYDAYH